MSIREKDIEKKALRQARAKGDYARKFTSTARRSVPDDVLITEGVTWFCEFKAPKKRLTELQTEEHEAIFKAGGFVFTASSVDEFHQHRTLIADHARGIMNWMRVTTEMGESFEKYQYQEAA